MLARFFDRLRERIYAALGIVQREDASTRLTASRYILADAEKDAERILGGARAKAQIGGAP